VPKGMKRIFIEGHGLVSAISGVELVKDPTQADLILSWSYPSKTSDRPLVYLCSDAALSPSVATQLVSKVELSNCNFQEPLAFPSSDCELILLCLSAFSDFGLLSFDLTSWVPEAESEIRKSLVASGYAESEWSLIQELRSCLRAKALPIHVKALQSDSRQFSVSVSMILEEVVEEAELNKAWSAFSQSDVCCPAITLERLRVDASNFKRLHFDLACDRSLFEKWRVEKVLSFCFEKASVE